MQLTKLGGYKSESSQGLHPTLTACFPNCSYFQKLQHDSQKANKRFCVDHLSTEVIDLQQEEPLKVSPLQLQPLKLQRHMG